MKELKYLVIGAGPCGLVIAKFLAEANIAYEQVDADNDVGGNWYHGVYDAVYTDADKSTMEFPFYRMPAAYPDFLSANQMLQYYRDFADAYHLRKHIQFNTKVIWVQAIENNLWKVCFADYKTVIYKGVIICNGHHWDMDFPIIPGKYSGELLHSKQYKNGKQLKDKSVLVVGARNSAVDIACEAARYGKKSIWCVRDSPWIIPKAFMGKPLSKLGAGAPDFLKPYLLKLLVRISFGKHAYYKMPAPKHQPLEKLPTMSEELPYYLRHGRVRVKPDILRANEKLVQFADGTTEEVDLIIAATGFKLSFPFLPKSLCRTEGKNLLCYGYSAYADYKGLFFFGWPQVIGGIGQLSGIMAKGLCDLIKLEEEYSIPSGAVLKSMGDAISKTYRPRAKEIFAWVKQHSYKRLAHAAGRLPVDTVHSNQLTEEPAEQMGLALSVY